jgi:hypothetical protein
MDKYTRIYSTDSIMCMYGRGFVDGDTFLYYTNDGATWSTGSTPTLYASTTNNDFDSVVYWPQGILEWGCASNDSAGNSCDDQDIYQIGASMAIFQTAPASVAFTQSAPDTRHAVDQGYNGAVANMSTKALIDDPNELIGCARLVNAMANLIGVEISGTDTNLYLYDPATNTFGSLLETMTTDAAIDPKFNPDSTWFVNGTSTAWLIGLNDSTGNWEVWERDANFAASDANFTYLHSTGGIPASIMELPA